MLDSSRFHPLAQLYFRRTPDSRSYKIFVQAAFYVLPYMILKGILQYDPLKYFTFPFKENMPRKVLVVSGGALIKRDESKQLDASECLICSNKDFDGTSSTSISSPCLRISSN